MRKNWVKGLVWLWLLAISNPVVYANAGTHLRMLSETVVEVPHGNGVHMHAKGHAESHADAPDHSDNYAECSDNCCGLLNCRTQPASMAAAIALVVGGAEPFEGTQPHYAYTALSSLYRPPSLL